jgi:hypothetical protein
LFPRKVTLVRREQVEGIVAKTHALAPFVSGITPALRPVGRLPPGQKNVADNDVPFVIGIGIAIGSGYAILR